MSTFRVEHEVLALSVQFSDEAIIVMLDDGRTLSVPLSWYPRLLQGTGEERKNYELIGGGQGIHWPALDEDISVESMLAGHSSSETASSVERWKASRR